MTTLSPSVPPRMTIPDFLAFYEARPDGERWELIDGDALMMTPPVIAHQRVADNLLRHFDDLIDRLGLPLVAVREIGLETPAATVFRPEPDITITDADFALDQTYCARFDVVVEVLSPSDSRTLGKKMAYFRRHPSCHAILLVRANEVWADIHVRTAAGWENQTLTDLDSPLVIPQWGELCTLRQVYARTSLSR